MDINPPTLPNVEAVVIPTEKVRDYLLDLGHADGGSKAKFFIHFGFNRERWEELAEALSHHAKENPVCDVKQDAAGTSYAIEGAIETPSERRPKIRAIWLVETAGLAPRFITAYPLKHDS
jgi:hypothetical protein